MDARRLRQLQRKPRRRALGLLIGTVVLTIGVGQGHENERDVPQTVPVEEIATVSLGERNVPSPLAPEAVPSPSMALKTVCPHFAESDQDGDTLHEILDVVGESTVDFSIEAELLFAVMAVESRCQSKARSHAGALGIMQLMPKTASWLGVSNPLSVRGNIRGGAEYLAKLLSRFDGDLPLALAAYNAGPTVVSRYGSIPPYPETEAFVARVLSYYGKLRSEGTSEA